jgi:hypothetical protein
MPTWVVARRVTSSRWPTVDRRPGVTTSPGAARHAARLQARDVGGDGWPDGLLMELLAGEERSHAAALCWQALRIVGSGGPWGRAAG